MQLRSGQVVRRQEATKVEKIEEERACFFDLPPEIRNIIYTYILTSQHVKIKLIKHEFFDEPWHRAPTGLTPTILLACQAVYCEATPVLYGSYSFDVELATDFLTTIGSGRKFLRTITLNCKCGTANDMTRSLSLLKDAKQLHGFLITGDCSRFYKGPEALAKKLVPLLRVVRKNCNGSTDILEMVPLPSTAYLRARWYFMGPKAANAGWTAYRKRVHDVLRERIS